MNQEFRKIIILILAAPVTVFFSASGVFSAPRSEELEKKIMGHEIQISELEREIAGYRTEIVKTTEESKTLSGVIRSVDLNRKKLGADISITANKIESSEASIEQIGLAIDVTRDKIDRSRDSIAAIFRAVDESTSRTFAEILLLHDSMSEALSDLAEYASINSRIREEIGNLLAANEKMAVQKTEQEKEKRKLVSQRSVLSDQKSILDSEKKSKDLLLAQTKNKESEYKKMLANAEARKEAMEQELLEFSAQIKQEVDPESIPPPGTKILSPPLDTIRVTQRFGRTVDSVRLYASGTHNGIDFGASRGSKVYAMADGVVTAVGNTDEIPGCYSYGKWILVKHGNGLSTMYAHLDLVKISAGQEVKRGALIGFSGKTGYATGPHLHLTVYASSAVKIMKYEKSNYCKAAVIPIAPVNGYLDPESYMQ